MVTNTFKASPFLLSSLVILNFGYIGIGAFLLYVIRDATDEGIALIEGTSTIEKVLLIVVLYLVLELVVKVVIDWLRDLARAFYFYRAEVYYGRTLLYKFGKLPQVNMYNKEVYEKFTFTYDNLYMFSELPWSLMQFLINFGFQKLLYIAIIFSFNVYLGIYCIALFLLSVSLGGLINNRIGKTHKSMVKPRRIQRYFESLVSDKRNVKESKIYRLENHFFKIIKEQYVHILYAYFKVYRLNEVVNQIILFINYLMRAGLTVFLIYTVYQGDITVGEAILIQVAALTIINSSWEFKRPVEDIVRFVSYSPTMIEMLFPVTKEDKREIKKLQYPEFKLELGALESITLEDVSFSYPSREDEQVSDVNLTIHKGDIISILGYNGSGKTTLTKMIAGVLDPTKGRLLYNGKPLVKEQKEKYYKYFGIGFQDYGKYNLSLKENIVIGKVEEEYTDEELESTIYKANLSMIIDKLPDGIDTVLGKQFHRRGQDLSGGEWQKVILSRAYMGNPEVLILDEPTASIDPFEEERMLENFESILEGNTAILISHRISFARLANKIIMMKDGKIVEQGTHDELLALNGYYSELFIAQKKLYVDGGEEDGK